MWLLAVSCFCFTSLFSTNLIESSKEQIQNQQLECDPAAAENCDIIQITSNESSSIVRQSEGSNQISIQDSLEAENREVKIDNPGTQEGKKIPPKSDNDSPPCWLYINFERISFKDPGRYLMYLDINGE